MNDVLPKPFTKEGLLSMLEKHLGHLKKAGPGMEQMGAPPPPTLAQVAAKNSMKSEDSPATSPATVSNWASPSGNLGVSPPGGNTEEYMQAVQAHAPLGPYAMAPGMQAGVLGPAIGYGGSPPRLMAGPGPLQLPPQGQAGPHRRHISEISGGAGEIGGDIKRQQIIGFPPPPPGPMTPTGMPGHMGGQVMGQPLQSPIHPLHRRPG